MAVAFVALKVQASIMPRTYNRGMIIKYLKLDPSTRRADS